MDRSVAGLPFSPMTSSKLTPPWQPCIIGVAVKAASTVSRAEDNRLRKREMLAHERKKAMRAANKVADAS